MIAAVLAAVILAAPGAPPAAGSVGAGTQANDICLAKTLHPGSTVHAQVYVQNTGTDPGFIAVTIGPPPRPSQLGPLHPPLSSYTLHARPVPVSWVATESAYLVPGHGKTVPLTVTLPGDAGGQYEATINVNPAGTAPAGPGASASLGGGAATYLKFAVDAPPPDCTPADVNAGPWWARPKAIGFRLPAGWSYYEPLAVWTYIPPASPVFQAGMPPGWSPRRQMQAMISCCADFVLRHEPGWRYLADEGPLGVIIFNPPSGRLPAWALAMAEGRPYHMPDPGWPGGIPTAGTGTVPGTRAASPAAAWGDPQTPADPGSKRSLTGLLAITAVVSVGGWGLNRIRRRRGGSR